MAVKEVEEEVGEGEVEGRLGSLLINGTHSRRKGSGVGVRGAGAGASIQRGSGGTTPRLHTRAHTDTRTTTPCPGVRGGKRDWEMTYVGT